MRTVRAPRKPGPGLCSRRLRYGGRSQSIAPDQPITAMPAQLARAAPANRAWRPAWRVCGAFAAVSASGLHPSGARQPGDAMNGRPAARRRIPARCRRVAVERLAYAVGVREALVGLEAAGSDRGHLCIEIVDEYRHHGRAAWKSRTRRPAKRCNGNAASLGRVSQVGAGDRASLGR
jgi:hypothetical protein